MHSPKESPTTPKKNNRWKYKFILFVLIIVLFILLVVFPFVKKQMLHPTGIGNEYISEFDPYTDDLEAAPNCHWAYDLEVSPRTSNIISR